VVRICSYFSVGRNGSSRWRAPAADFSASFSRLCGAVEEACASEGAWEEKVAAGIRSALVFVAADPAAAKALTIDARAEALGDGDRQDEVVAHFAELLRRAAPSEKRFPISTDRGIVESIMTLIRGHILAGTTDELPALVPDVVYLALMPYAGLFQARRLADSMSSLHLEVQFGTNTSGIKIAAKDQRG
jgi:hypothetical protein